MKFFFFFFVTFQLTLSEAPEWDMLQVMLEDDVELRTLPKLPKKLEELSVDELSVSDSRIQNRYVFFRWNVYTELVCPCSKRMKSFVRETHHRIRRIC